MADLQELVDDLALAIGRPIAVDDRRWRLLASSAHAAEPDAVRRTSLLARSVAPEVGAWLESLGLLRAREPVETPRNDELDMAERWCVPLRHGDRLLGFLWVIVADRPLDAAERARVDDGARAACAELWRRWSEADARLARIRAAVADGTAEELAAALAWPAGARYAVAVADPDDALAERLRRRWPGGETVWLPDRTLVHLRDAAPATLAAALTDAGASHVGVSAAHTDLAALATATRQAHLARLVAKARGGGSAAPPAAAAPSASGAARGGGGAAPAAPSAPFAGAGASAWDGLGAWAEVAWAWDAAGRPEAPEAVRALAAHRHAADLLAAAEAVLDAAGDVTAAAARLHVHRATLYRRLERVEEVTGLRLASGDDRLLLHLGLRVWRLGQAAA